MEKGWIFPGGEKLINSGNFIATGASKRASEDNVECLFLLLNQKKAPFRNAGKGESLLGKTSFVLRKERMKINAECAR
jgi:hypothetical protein